MRKYHPFGIVICYSEQADDFAFIFQALHNFDEQWRPTILLADVSDAITNGYRKVFGDPIIRLMCFFHVLHNSEKYLKPLAKGGVAGKLRADIDLLQLCDSEAKFQKASELFLEKWRHENNPAIVDFISYFQDQWLSKKNS